jgi:hypothetical protein
MVLHNYQQYFCFVIGIKGVDANGARFFANNFNAKFFAF